MVRAQRCHIRVNGLLAFNPERWYREEDRLRTSIKHCRFLPVYGTGIFYFFQYKARLLAKNSTCQCNGTSDTNVFLTSNV